jgi:hypothetical protein
MSREGKRVPLVCERALGDDLVEERTLVRRSAEGLTLEGNCCESVVA